MVIFSNGTPAFLQYLGMQEAPAVFHAPGLCWAKVGVAFAVSVHIRDAEDLVHKSIIKKLYLTGEFDYVVLLEEYGDTFSVVDLRGGGDEDPWTVDDRTFLRGDRYFTGS